MIVEDYRLERIRVFAASRLFPRSDADNFCARVQRHNYEAVCLWEDRIRIGRSIYRLDDEEAADTMAYLLADYIREHGLKVKVLHV